MNIGRIVVLLIVISGGLWLVKEAPQAAANKKVYEQYEGNTVTKRTWSDSEDQMVFVKLRKGIKSFWIDRFEATISQRRAWSVAGQTPTTKLTYQDAKEACSAAGKRLCKTSEWRIACRDGKTNPVYFKNTKEMAKKCDFARSKGYDRLDYPNKTNTHPACATPNLGIHHIIGNLSEMTEGPNGGATIVGMTYYDAHYKDKDNALRMSCEHTIFPEGRYPANKYNEGMGFRCCKD